MTTTQIKALFAQANFEHDGHGEYSSRGTYVTQHGEYSRPRFRVRRYKDGMGIYVRYSYYAGTCYAKQSGRMSVSDFETRYCQ